MILGRFPLSSYVHSAPGSYAQSCCKFLIGQVSQGKGKKFADFPVIILVVFKHLNNLCTNPCQKKLAQSVQPFYRTQTNQETDRQHKYI